MKKIVLFLIVCFATTSFMISCKSGKDAKANFIGTWVGKYDDQTGNGLNKDICVEVKEGNELIVHDKTAKPNATGVTLGKGTWSVKGEAFIFEYKYPNNPEDTATHHNEGKLVNDSKKIDGTLRKAGNQELGGFYLDKQ